MYIKLLKSLKVLFVISIAFSGFNMNFSANEKESNNDQSSIEKEANKIESAEEAKSPESPESEASQDDVKEEAAPLSSNSARIATSINAMTRMENKKGEFSQLKGPGIKPFTVVPGEELDYRIDITKPRNHTNHQDHVYGRIVVYIPVFKEGMNAGLGFQSTPMLWNMTPTGQTSLKIINKAGEDMSDRMPGHFQVSYTDDAINDSNYKNANYLTSPSKNSKMIRVIMEPPLPPVNNPQVQNWVMTDDEVIEIKIGMKVEETGASILQNPAKVGSVISTKQKYEIQNIPFSWKDGPEPDDTFFVDGGEQEYSLGTGDLSAISGNVFNDKVVDGVYTEETTDEKLAGKKVKLLKKAAGDTYVEVATTTTDASGRYIFDVLDKLGIYKVDFNDVLGLDQKFTAKNFGANDNIDSDVDVQGANVGTVSDIIPTEPSSWNISAGIIEYKPEDLKIFADDAHKNITMKASNINGQRTYTIPVRIEPLFFEEIKNSVNGVRWESSNTNAVTVSQIAGTNNALLTAGSTPGETSTVTLTIVDMYGTEVTKTFNVTIVTNNVPTSTQLESRIEAGTVITDAFLRSLVRITDTEDGDFTGITTINHNIVVNGNGEAEASQTGYNVTYRMLDTDNNPGVFSYNVTVSDTQGPSLTVDRKVALVKPSKDAVPTNWRDVFGVNATDRLQGNITNQVGYQTDANLTSMNKKGLYTIVISVADQAGNATTETVQLLITDSTPVSGRLIDANSFTVKLSEVDSSKYINLAGAKAYVLNATGFYDEVTVTTNLGFVPTTAGIHPVTFTAGISTITVNMFVVANDFIGTELIYANDFAIKLSEVGTADYIKLADAKAYDNRDTSNVVAVGVKVKAHTAPTSIGRYKMTFTTDNNTEKE
ncbi:MAG: SdrD B-like domain-containing protein, partial [Culicoidibacterales bacterium]